ncbi:ATP-binding cassette domain-containing protein [uncultured Mailhella sp.]|uniref:ATP-binding cassette domain-containing protein n=1 Tax=uncultured Mailhella sp. TaxID=1981031 RepID=UPI002605D4A8|nr:ATP-binding cassette domain-containing protein [uncultured Mailhella sp.]
MALLSIQNAELTLGSQRLLDRTELFVEQGDRLCIVGRNGAGKSSLLSVLAGRLPLDAGERHAEPGIRIGYVQQSVPEQWKGPVFSVTADALGEEGRLLAAAHLIASDRRDMLAPDLARQADSIMARGEVWERHGEVLGVIHSLGLPPEADFSALSGGTKRRVALARALIASDLLLLDEPTNHLDISTIRWLEEYLARQSRTLVFISHDRAFVRRLAARIAELDRARLYCYACGFDTYLERREERLHAEDMQNAVFDKKLAQEEVWIRQGIRARRTRNMGRVRELVRMRAERAERRARPGTAVLAAQEAERSGKLVAEMKDVSFVWPDGYRVFEHASLTIQRGDKIGLIGDNGAGKTTFLRVLLGQFAPTSGSVRLGTNLEIAYFDQLRDTLDDAKSVMDNVAKGSDRVTVNGESRHVASYLRDFLFEPDRLRTPAGLLSGGERSRLLLARLFTRPSNLLVLDEPTNDLDTETLELLEELLASYKGTVLVVSHDRAFLDELVTGTIALEGDGLVRDYVGGYSDWLRQRQPGHEAGKSADARAAWKAAAPRKRRLSYKEQREREALLRERDELPARLDALEREQKALEAALGDPDLFSRDPEGFKKDAARLEAVEEEQLALLERSDAIDARLKELELPED